MGKRRELFVTCRRGVTVYPSGFFRSPALLIATAQLIVACSGIGSDHSANMPHPDGQTAGSDGAGAAPEAGAGGAAGATPEAGVAGAAGGTPSGDGGAGGTSESQFSEGGAGGADDAFVPAPHAPFPLVTAHGGPVIPHIELVPVYFGPDPLFAELESFNTWLVGSKYWKTVGADYGVFSGTRLPSVQFDSPPTSPVSIEQIRGWLDAQIASGHLPKPSAQTVFIFYYPAGTKITIDGLSSCSVFSGLHDSAPIDNAVFTGEVPFVVIPRCSFSAGDELMIATDVASHELIEAATDPFGRTNPAWQMDNDHGPLEAWFALTGTEVADLCLNQSYDDIDGFSVNDIWSNQAAQAGNNPCQPSDPKHPFFSVSADETIYHAQPGTTLSIHSRAWSNMPARDWELAVNWGWEPSSDFNGQAVLSTTTVNNGDEVTATVTIPANPPMNAGRSAYRFTIDSIDPINPNFSHPWPFLVIVP